MDKELRARINRAAHQLAQLDYEDHKALLTQEMFRAEQEGVENLSAHLDEILRARLVKGLTHAND